MVYVVGPEGDQAQNASDFVSAGFLSSPFQIRTVGNLATVRGPVMLKALFLWKEQ